MSDPIYGSGYRFGISLIDSANRPQFKTSPTISDGDFKISKNGGAFANLTALPSVVPAGGKLLEITLSSTETSTSRIDIIGSDQAGSEWDDIKISFFTALPLPPIVSSFVVQSSTSDAFTIFTGGSSTDDFYNGMLVAEINNSTGQITQTNIVKDYDAITKTLTAYKPWISTPKTYLEGHTWYACITGTPEKVHSVVGAVGSVADPSSIWAHVIDGTRTAVQLMRGMVAALLGKSSGHAAGTPKYRDIADTKNVIDATTDVDGNRTNVNTDLS